MSCPRRPDLWHAVPRGCGAASVLVGGSPGRDMEAQARRDHRAPQGPSSVRRAVRFGARLERPAVYRKSAGTGPHGSDGVVSPGERRVAPAERVAEPARPKAGLPSHSDDRMFYTGSVETDEPMTAPAPRLRTGRAVRARRDLARWGRNPAAPGTAPRARGQAARGCARLYYAPIPSKFGSASGAREVLLRAFLTASPS